jgi:ATP-binding cassette subfamily B protein
MIAVHVGALFRQRLLAGAMKLDPDDLRSAGPSQHLGRVLEASVVENFIIGGGFLAVMGILELLFAAFVLGSGATGVWHVSALCFWVALLLVFSWPSFRRCAAAVKARTEMTHDLVEKMVGYRTVAAQQLPERLHAAEDAAVSSFQRLLRSLDRLHTTVEVLMSHGWTACGVFVLLLFLFFARSIDPTKVAITIGGILLAERALSKVAMAVWQSVEAVIAWRNVKAILSAASRREIPEAPGVSDSVVTKRLEIRNVVFGYRGEAVAAGWNLAVEEKDRVLVQGPSGGGKSTLCALVTGIRRPGSGTILFGGLDQSTLGERAWHRRIGLAPQFHENHVFAESFAFNLLMGRRWPPTASDLKEAETICRELGLADLLERMPGGMFQVVGDTGWQLSHGERSRLFIARVLLQKADVVVLDESFAALDPENFEAALDCAMRRASSLIVVAHP